MAKQRVRIGARDTFLKKAEGVLFTGRKSFSTKATFTGVLTLGVISSLGAFTSIFTPTAVGQQPGMDQYLTGGFATIAAYGMFKAADNMANQWWVQEK